MKRSLLTLLVILTSLVAVSGPAAPARAQGGVAWNAQYYDNAYLIGKPAATALIPDLKLDWGQGSPGESIPADNWSARFGTDVYLNAGTYRFYLLADDSVKLTVDFLPLGQQPINTFIEPKPGQLLTADVQVSTGLHHIQVDYRENSGNAYLYVTWEPLDASLSGPGFPAAPAAPVASSPWGVQYYNNIGLAGAPLISATEASPSHNWGAGSPGAGMPVDYWSARWSSAQTLNAGTYTLTVQADDGVRVFMDGVLILDEWHTANGQTYTVPLTVTAGVHTFVVEYYEVTVNAYLAFSLTQAQAPAPAPTGATATVKAWVLNVRNAPLTGAVIAKVRFNETYNVVGRNSDSSWWQINVNGTIGWVSGRYVTVTNPGSVPVTG